MADSARETADPALVLERGCAVFDRSERGKLALSGTDAIEFLNGQVTNELQGLAAGEGRYAAFLNHKGGMLGDARILHAVDPGAPELGELLLLDMERAALQPVFDTIRAHSVGFDVVLHKRTLERGQLTLIGPRSSELAAARHLGEAEHDSATVTIAGVQALAVRTDVGVDVFCDAAALAQLHESFIAGGAIAGDEQSAAALRIESGRPLFGVDIEPGTIPQEAGLNERAVSFTKGCYVGQETVARLFYKGRPNRSLRGLGAARPLREGEAVTLDGRAIGRVGSAALSPRFGPIALALLRREAQPGVQVELEDGGEATVVELPFAAVPAGEHR
ncbi:MAG TPA: glycine cleavage T C-terminal barrel domain-containing protein [Solirubrobacteraceae bacterium]|nr:glycine cleavage T C-terminal barrel domain-containing protein [Solirubrobacteraceae bacterium]